MSEHRIQNEIRNALAGQCLAFRANVGQAWAGEVVARLPNGDMVLRNPRPFSTGLPPGFSDVFGLVRVEITQDMVGQVLGVFHAVEVKDAKGRLSANQANFLRAVNDNGGRAGVARSANDALRIVRGDKVAA